MENTTMAPRATTPRIIQLPPRIASDSDSVHPSGVYRGTPVDSLRTLRRGLCAMVSEGPVRSAAAPMVFPPSFATQGTSRKAGAV
ncbi:hypothetical protein JCM16814_26860 [Desulfobaculum senezii]